MACLTCGHVMKTLGDDWWWCPRCGTLTRDDGEEGMHHEIPALVKYTRQLVAALEGQSLTSHLAVMARAAAQEASLTPEERR